MTRTARAAYPRAIIKDRSLSRAGVDTSIRKQGAGQHNWGSLTNERELEKEALEDQALEGVDESKIGDDYMATSSTSLSSVDKPAQGNNGSLSDDDLMQARKIRKNAFKKQYIDLNTIARSSAALSTSPPSVYSSQQTYL